MNYRVTPGLYAVGQPDSQSPVLVSANYKLSFDALRKELSGLNLWILVIDTKGVNVWCAAGKGTFGTKELIKRIYQTKLPQVVEHRTLILPQLSAPGIAAHTVTKVSKFKVVYGPVRASDLPAFLAAGMVATSEMRTVEFPLKERAVLTPIELVQSFKWAVRILAILLIANLITLGTVSVSDLPGSAQAGLVGGLVVKTVLNFLPFCGAIFIGAVLVPILLPWIPGRAFAFKGWLLGILWALGVVGFADFFALNRDWSTMLSLLLFLPAISAYLGMNFTGSSTFTSRSGVQKEMKWALPSIIASAGLGLVMFIVSTVMEFVG